MSLRVARIPYLNSLPFYACLPEGTEELDLPPRQLGEAAASGAVDAGILSLCDIMQTPGLEPLGDLGVAVNGPAHSVLLFSREHPEQLQGTIGITSETSTSFPLLRLLLSRRFGASRVEFARLLTGSPPADPVAELLIGDAALVAAAAVGLVPGSSCYEAGPMPVPRADASRWSWVLDLGACWVDWQGLPFVFAEWVVRGDAASGARRALGAAIDESLRRFESDPDAVAAEASGWAGLQHGAVRAYLQGFTYRLGAAERAGIARFQEMLGESPWWTAAHPATRERA